MWATGHYCAALLLVTVFSAFIAVRMRGLTGGPLVYPLDDTYIHMAIARNVALHGVWGVSSGPVSATSSSPLWTALLSLAYVVTGVHDLTPLVLNTVFAVLCVVYVADLLKREGLDGAALFAVLATSVLLAPLAPMAWLGMEHTLHILLTVLTVAAVGRLRPAPSRSSALTLCVLAAAMVAARYEGLFVVAGCALALLLSRRRAAACAVITAGVVPVVAVGLWNLAHGWFFLPASILLKQAVLQPAGSVLPSSLYTNVTEAPAAFFVLLVSGLLLLAYQAATRGFRAVHPFLLIFVTAAALHAVFAKFGHLYRYESYLMVLGTLTIGVSLFGRGGVLSGAGSSRSNRELVLVVIALFCMALGSRTLAANAVTANMTGHIYRQQRQVAELLREYYDGEPVALNDIGASSYLTHVQLTDMVGLGTLEVAKLRRAGLWDRRHMIELLEQQHVELAIVYDTWFPAGHDFYQEWIRVGEWTTDDEETRGEGTVSFFARDTPPPPVCAGH